MARLTAFLLFIITSATLFAQDCNLNDAILTFNKAQELDDQESASLYEKSANEFKCCKQYENYLIAAYQSGMAYLSTDRAEKAKEILEQGMQDAYDLIDQSSEVVMLISHALGEIYYDQKNIQKSIFYFNNALKILGDDDSEELAVCLFNLGNAYEIELLYYEAIACHRKSILMKERLEVADSNDYYQSFSALGDLYQLTDKQDSATFYYKQAGRYVDIKNNESVAYIKYKDALELYGRKQYDESEMLFAEAKSLCEVSDIRNDVYVSSCLYLGLISEQNGRYQKAENLLTNALKFQETQNDTYYAILLYCGRVESNLDKNQEATQKLRQVAEESKDRELSIIANIEIAKILTSQGFLQEAENSYRQSLSEIDSVKSPIAYVQAVCGVGNILSAKNEHEQAISKYRQAIESAGNDAYLEALVYESIGNEYLALGDFRQAIENFNSSYDILKNEYGESSIKALSARENIANVHMVNEQFAEASLIYERSLSAKISQLGENNRQLLVLYSNLGNAKCNQSDYAEAEKLYAKALEIIESEKIGSEKLDAFYNNYSLYCKAVGDYKQAIKYAEISLEVKEKLYGKENAKTIGAINNIGTIYDRLGNFAKAAECFDTAEQLLLKLGKTESMELCDVYINKGNLYSKSGQNDLALDYYNKALAISNESENEGNKRFAPIYNNIGIVYQNIEEYRKAVFYFSKSLNIRKKYYSENSQEVAESYNNIGTVSQKMGNTGTAIDNYLKACEIYGNISTLNPILLGNTENNIATAYSEMQNKDSAMIYYKKAEKTYISVYGAKHPNLALIYNNIGNIYLESGNYAGAIESYNKSLEANTENYNAETDSISTLSDYFDKKTIVNTIILKASAYVQRYVQDKGRPDLFIAIGHYLASDKMISEMRKSALSKADKLELGKLATKCYEGIIEAYAELLKTEKGDKRPHYEEQLFAYIEKGKSNTLLESIAGQNALQLANIPQEMQQTENQLSSDVLYYEKLLAEKPQNAVQIRDSLFEANKRYNEYIRNLEEKYPEYHQLKYADNAIGLRELQKQIESGTQVRMYVQGNDVIYLACITDSNFSMYVSNAIINTADTIRAYRNSIMQTSQKAAFDFNRISNLLYKMLFPDTINQDIRNLVIVPDGMLNQIPYESLLCKEESSFDYSNFDFLIKRYSISYAYSATLYHRSKVRAVNSDGWLGMAPIFTTGKHSGVVLDNRLKKHETQIDGIKVVESSKIEPLASSETEVRNIFSMFTKAQRTAKACLWGCANKQNFISDSISNYKYIHLATHGFVNSEKPELSGIQFSCLSGDEQKGLLYSNDVYGMKMNCDLLVLSACETGLGKIMKGEGIIGLTRAFIYAGASNLLVSLWKVSDNSTSQLMTEFYKQMLQKENEGKNYAELLQKAKQTLIFGKDYSRPYYWASFIIIGD